MAFGNLSSRMGPSNGLPGFVRWILVLLGLLILL
jgi:hypothetical protein